MNEEMISVIEAGKRLERRKSTIFEVMRRLGIEARKRRDTGSGNQLVSYLSETDFIRIKDALLSSNSNDDCDMANDYSAEFVSAEIGVFYLIQLEPDHDPLRFKVGFAANMNVRLRALRCSAPFSTLVRSWQCRRLWERTAIDCVTNGCDRLHTEVYRCNSLEAVVGKCERFFAMMPPSE